MSVERDESGHRHVRIEVEVPGTPEEVWRAIATGAGISSWFVPTEVDERVGGKIKSTFGPGMDSISTIKVWDPPHRNVSESKDLGPDAPTVASEWTVEAKSGGTCIVRIVHSLFASSDDWDNELEAWEGGWPDFFKILRLYLTHFPGQSSALLDLSATTSRMPAEAWREVCGALGLVGITEGEQRAIDVAGLPAFGLQVEFTGKPPHEEHLLVRTSGALPGLAHLFALRIGEQTVVSIRFYVYGAMARETVDRLDPAWQKWMSDLFPPES